MTRGHATSLVNGHVDDDRPRLHAPQVFAAVYDRYGDAGINPQVVWTNGTLASLAVGSFVKLVTPWSEFSDSFTWLELDGNRQTVVPSRQPEYRAVRNACPHHGGKDGMGDPFFSLTSGKR